MIRPDIEKTDCEICKRYEHYGWSNADESKRGRPIKDPAGMYIERSARSNPDCRKCPVSMRWTADNLGLYRRYRMHTLGIDTGPIDTKAAWAFYALAEEESEIAQKQSATCPLMQGA